MMLLAALGLAVFFITGVLGIGFAVRTFRRVAPLLRTAESRIGDVTPEDGPVKIGGRAARDGSTDLVEAPLSEQECLAFAYEIQEMDQGGWATIGSGFVGGPLLIEDGSGTVRIDPTDAIPHLNHSMQDASWDDPFPDELQEYVPERRNTGSKAYDLWLRWSVTRKRRFVEGRIEEGEWFTVFGEPQPAEPVRPGTPTPDISIGAGTGSFSFVITDGSWSRTAWKFGKKGLGQLLIGVLSLGAGLAILLTSARI